MIDLLANSIAGKIFSTEGSTHTSIGMSHHKMVPHAYCHHTRKWVGLELSEIEEIILKVESMGDPLFWMASKVEAKLKEKNNVVC